MDEQLKLQLLKSRSLRILNRHSTPKQKHSPKEKKEFDEIVGQIKDLERLRSAQEEQALQPV